jgi:hypothetical protein
MSANDYRIHKSQGQQAVPQTAGAWTVKVTATPATIHDLVRVRAINGARGRIGVELGLTPWVKPRSKEKPEEGDIGIALIDEEGAPWVVGWKVQ